MSPQTPPAIRLFQIDYALQDIQATLFCHRNAPLNDPYVAKLYSQWDALLDEKRAIKAAI